MKITVKILYFTILPALVWLTGCTKSNDEGGVSSLPEQDLIELRADTGRIAVEVETDAQTKAPVLSWNNDRVTFAYGNTANNYIAQWNALVLMHGDVIFSPVRPYNTEDLVMHLKGYHPRGEVRGGDYNKAYIKLTGSEDLMVSQDVNIGRLEDKKTDVVARFEHKLAQFQFKAINNPSVTTGSPTATFPISGRLYKIILSGAPATPIHAEAIVDLTDNSITYGGDPVSLVVYENTNGLLITRTSSNILPSIPIVMFEPGKKMQLTIEYSENEDGSTRKSVTNDIVTIPQQGYAYEITISFSGIGFYTSSFTLAAWTTVSTTNEVTGGSVVMW